MEHPNSLQDLHNRYLLQAKWTGQNRHRLYQSANLHPDSRVLEVGSGTGAIIHEIADLGLGTSHGIDIDAEAVLFARNVDPRTRYAVGDGCRLPYKSETFDATICHFLLMWVPEPLSILKEMGRVTKVGGAILALAEPDYGGRIDFPEALETLGHQQAKALNDRGADTQMGRQLRMLFTKAGLANIHSGVLGGEWIGPPDEMGLHSEWMTLIADLEGRLPEEKMEEYQELDRTAWLNGFRVLFVPTFFAIGWHKGG
jgi:SAM-dependent methyltransferase